MARAGCLAAALAFSVLLAAVAVGAWFLLVGTGASPTSVDDAVTTFREESAEGPPGLSPVPEGVYVYATDGHELTDALTGERHRYPSTSTITVTRHECGVRVRWDVLEGRSTTWTYCVGPDGWTLASQDERHTFFGRTDTTTYECTDTPFRPAGDPEGATFEITCSTGPAEERGEGRVVGTARTTVGGREVEVVRLRKTSAFTGAVRGTARHDVWIARDTGVPVQLVMVSATTNDSPLGDVRYEEDVSLRLVSLDPRR